MGFTVFLEEEIRPSGFVESDCAGFSRDCEGAFNKVAVLGEEINGLVVGHVGEIFLHVHRLVIPSGGVEQFPDIALVASQHRLEFWLGRRLLPDWNNFVINRIGLEEFFSLTASVTVFVGVNFQRHLFLKKKAAFGRLKSGCALRLFICRDGPVNGTRGFFANRTD